VLKNASEVTALVPKNIFFLKILNLVQSFVECKVSPADGKPAIGILSPTKYQYMPPARLTWHSTKFCKSSKFPGNKVFFGIDLRSTLKYLQKFENHAY
jgi:hypothetical protein